MRTALDWISYFADVSKHLFVSLEKRVVFQPDGSGSPVAMALRDAVLSWPFPTKILFLDTEGSTTARSGDRIWTLLRFDFSAPKISTFKELGSVSVTDFEKVGPFLQREFGLPDEDWESLSSMLGNWDGPLVGHLVGFDIRSSAERYAFELAQFLFDGTDRLVALFGRAVDFNAKYGLKPDPILSAKSLLQVDSLTALFGDNSRRHLRRHQAEVASIQLIPQVTTDVRLTFSRAKRLYVFGYFVYDFFTVSVHYAYAALEAALYARWSAMHSGLSTISYGADSFQIGAVSHAGIRSQCKRRGWRNLERVTVNGQPFPHSSGKLLTALRQNGVINDWQKKRFKEVWLELRNAHSHMEQAATSMPDAGTLVRTAEEINILFDSLPPPLP